MEVHIDEIVSDISIVDDEAILRPEIMRKVVSATLRAVENRELHGKRRNSETAVFSSVRDPER